MLRVGIARKWQGVEKGLENRWTQAKTEDMLQAVETEELTETSRSAGTGARAFEPRLFKFDIHKSFSIAGTVAKVEWINPQSYLTLNVMDADGKVQKSAFEMGRRANFGEPG